MFLVRAQNWTAWSVGEHTNEKATTLPLTTTTGTNFWHLWSNQHSWPNIFLVLPWKTSHHRQSFFQNGMTEEASSPLMDDQGDKDKWELIIIPHLCLDRVRKQTAHLIQSFLNFFLFTKTIINIINNMSIITLQLWVSGQQLLKFLTRSDHRLYTASVFVYRCFFSIHPPAHQYWSHGDLKEWQKIGVTSILSPTQESFVKLANQYASHWNGSCHRQNVYLLKHWDQIFQDGSQDICRNIESNLPPATGF